jgi:Cu/Ag efflux protein CusF
MLGAGPASAQMQMKGDMQMQMAKEGVFEGKGKIVAVVPAKNQVVLDHEEIKGFMGAMTMGYAVRSPELLKGLNTGDAVKFKIDAGEKKIVSIERLP